MQASVAIVVVNFNGLEDTCACLASIAAMNEPQVLTIMVDNGSEIDPTERINRDFPWCITIRNPENLGWAGGNNTGIRAALEAGAEQVILLNNDTVVAPALVSELLAAAKANPEFGIIGPLINAMDRPDFVMTDGVVFNTPHEDGFFQRLEVPPMPGSDVVEVDIVNGCCMMISADVFAAIALIDEQFFLIHEESDFCLRAQQHGFRLGILGKSLLWHKQSTSFARAGKRIQRYYDTRNLHRLLKKHIGATRNGRSWRQSWIEYYKYAYHRYCIELEHGKRDSAEAVLEGVYDAWTKHFGGPVPPRRRRGLAALRWIMNSARWVKYGRLSLNRPTADVTKI
ncbi:MAG: glycosyltransferase family 2 protein [Planctomycetota bacterium]|nr:glycosyltransferase family 2 protein [Planctomycetota bacterium]